MKRIVTHISPDLDAITSVWLVHRFMPDWKKAHVFFVPAGETYKGAPPDTDPNIIHVDTGLGKFDHHQTSDKTCASRIIFEYLSAENVLDSLEEEALGRITDVVTRYDHFMESYLAEPGDDIHDFSISPIINGLKMKLQDDHEVVAMIETILDGLLNNFKNKINAEHVIEKGHTFTSPWGKSLALETDNENTMKLAQIQGYDLVVRKSPRYSYVRIKLHPRVEKTLAPIMKKLEKADSNATWFYHASGHMILNGSQKNANMTPSNLSLSQLISLITGKK